MSDIKDNNNNEQHQKIDIRDAASESYAGFAKEIIQDRALPDIRDGLLPVHRRIIYGMMKMGNTYNKPRVKAARSVGEVMGKYHPHGDCLRGNTLIKGLDNKTYTIEDLAQEQKDIEVLALDEDTGNVVPVVAHSFRVGQYTDLIYKITLSNGGIIEVTGNHPIFTEHTGWVKAEDLSVGDLLWTFKPSLGDRKECIRVVNIEMLKVEEEPMYDFTVDTYENMIIPISSEDGKDTYISVHNSSLYGAIVRQSQDWIVGYPLVDMKGNNGSIDGDSYAASRYCVVGDTIISLADDTFVKIKDIVPNIKEDSDEDIDLSVLDYQGNSVHASKLFHSGKHDTLKMTLSNGNDLIGTYNHLVLTIQLVDEVPTLRWKRFDQLVLGDYVLQVVGNGTCVEQTLTDDDLFAIFLGGIVSEGYVADERLHFSNTDKDYFDLVVRYVKQLGINNGLSERLLKSGKTIYEFGTFNVKDLYKGMEDIVGKKAASKEIPQYILTSSKQTQAQFLRSLFEGDGSVSLMYRRPTNKPVINIVYDSNSKTLIQQLQVMLLSFGITTSISKDNRSNRNTCFRLKITGERSIRMFHKEINFLTHKKQVLNDYMELHYGVEKRSVVKAESIPYLAHYVRDKYKEVGNRRGISHLITGNNFSTLGNKKKDKFKPIFDFIREELPELEGLLNTDYQFSKVVSIEEDGVQDVYSLRVDTDDHSFLTNGIVSHNTEVRLSKQAEYLYKGLHKKSVVDWMLTYDDSREEPIYLPAQYPNILAQGIKGISAGYATDILPHNIKELLESCIQLLDDPTLNYKQLAVKGPDFPTGGTITNGLNLDDMYEVGKGSVTLRGNYRIENPNKRSKYQYMVFYEIPYDTQKPNILLQIEDLLDKKQLNGVNLARDESGRDGLRLVLEIEKEANVEHIAQILFNKTDLEKKVHMNAVMIDNGKPRLYGLVTILNKFNEFRLQTMVRELNYDNDVDTARLHILEGFLVLVNNTDAIIKTVKQSSGKADARVQLVEQFDLSELQANAILDLQIHRMSQVSADDYLEELNQKKDAIDARNQILESDDLLKEYQKLNYQTIIDDLKTDTKRRTKVLKKVDEIEVNLESLIQEEDVVVGINGQGFIKRSTPRSYHATDKEGMDDFVLETDTHQYVVAWTNKGNYAFYPVHLIKEVRWGDEGVNITSLGIELESDEIIIGISQYDPDAYYFVLRSSGKGKVGLASDLEMSRYTKIYSVGGVKGDETVIQAGLISPDTRLALQTKKYVKTTKSDLTESVIFTPEELGTIGVKAYGRTLARIAKTKELLGVYEIAEDDTESVVGDNTESEQEVNTVSQLGKGTTEQDIQYRLPLIKYNQDPQHFTHPSVLLESLSSESEDSDLTGNSEDTHNQELAE